MYELAHLRTRAPLDQVRGRLWEVAKPQCRHPDLAFNEIYLDLIGLYHHKRYKITVMNPINTDSNTAGPQSTPDEQTKVMGDNSVSGSNLDSNKQDILPTALPQINNLSTAETAAYLKERDQLRKSPMINLLKIDEEEPVQAALAPQEPVATPPAAPKQSKTLLITAIIITITVIASASAYFFIMSSRKPSVVVNSSPAPTITPTPSETPTTSPTPEVTPISESAPATVTVPTITPTSDHPQMVTVQAKSGLWLRSSPTSINQKNVIGWMPNNAQVSVDQIGDFWWHGTYAGNTGYFASKYTQ